MQELCVDKCSHSSFCYDLFYVISRLHVLNTYIWRHCLGQLPGIISESSPFHCDTYQPKHGLDHINQYSLKAIYIVCIYCKFLVTLLWISIKLLGFWVEEQHYFLLGINAHRKAGSSKGSSLTSRSRTGQDFEHIPNCLHRTIYFTTLCGQS